MHCHKSWILELFDCESLKFSCIVIGLFKLNTFCGLRRKIKGSTYENLLVSSKLWSCQNHEILTMLLAC